MTRICRACLESISHPEYYNLNQSYPNSECSILKDRCKACIPELDLDITSDAVLCGLCYNTFSLFYNLRLKCLETEKRIQDLLREKNFVDLSMLVQQIPNEPTIKMEFENLDVCSATPAVEEVSDLEALLKSESAPTEFSDSYDKPTELVSDIPDVTSSNTCTVKNETSTSIHSTSSAEFMPRRAKKAFKCLDCDYSTSLRFNLQKHIKSHFGNKPYRCNVCGYSALQKCFLKSHMTTHSGSKPFSCGECDYKTAYRSNLQTHIRKHTGEKPYKCNICSNSYTQSNSLNRHIKTHTSSKAFKCHVCGYKTLYKSHLHTHLRIHTKDRFYVCNVCNEKFPQKVSFIDHLKCHTNCNDGNSVLPVPLSDF